MISYTVEQGTLAKLNANFLLEAKPGDRGIAVIVHEGERQDTLYLDAVEEKKD